LEAALLRLGISDLIQKIFTCSECKTTKTVPDIYLACCNFFNTKPEETVVFEDTLVAITTVANANFICVGIKDKSSSHDAEKIMQKTNYYIEDFNQFFDLDFVNK
jgi:beta-phosphoglucomutase-like phosphatase (HAD superfamily)